MFSRKSHLNMNECLVIVFWEGVGRFLKMGGRNKNVYIYMSCNFTYTSSSSSLVQQHHIWLDIIYRIYTVKETQYNLTTERIHRERFKTNILDI